MAPGRLVVVRHAHAEQGRDKSDRDRLLSERGVGDAVRLGEMLARFGLVPDVIVTSPALRAAATAERIAAACGFAGPLGYDDVLYDDGAAALDALASEVERHPRTILAVGHDPALSAWLSRVAGFPGRLPKGGVAVIAVAPLAGQRRRLLELWRPRSQPPTEAATAVAPAGHRAESVAGPESTAASAHSALEASCDRMTSRLSRCLETEADPHAEDVHRLRVACRRVEASLRVYRDVLDYRARRRVRKSIRRILAATGGVRDLDVTLAAAASASPVQDVSALVADLEARRAAALTAMRAALAEEANRYDVSQRVASLLDEVAVDGKARRHGAERFTDWARAQRIDAIDAFFAAEAELGQGIKDLHRLRLAAKRLRYTLDALDEEAEASGVTSSVRSLLVELQDVLGKASDHAAMAELLEELERTGSSPEARDAAALLRNVAIEGVAAASADAGHWWTAIGRPHLRAALEAVRRG